ncbi:hypothetical protein PINS_up000571 [Pythium insidiosum]|nr:hypothetical protein PINS_up000571 [Pythium insidiosum]
MEQDSKEKRRTTDRPTSSSPPALSSQLSALSSQLPAHPCSQLSFNHRQSAFDDEYDAKRRLSTLANIMNAMNAMNASATTSANPNANPKTNPNARPTCAPQPPKKTESVFLYALVFFFAQLLMLVLFPQRLVQTTPATTAKSTRKPSVAPTTAPQTSTSDVEPKHGLMAESDNTKTEKADKAEKTAKSDNVEKSNKMEKSVRTETGAERTVAELRLVFEQPSNTTDLAPTATIEQSPLPLLPVLMDGSIIEELSLAAAEPATAAAATVTGTVSTSTSTSSDANEVSTEVNVDVIVDVMTMTPLLLPTTPTIATLSTETSPQVVASNGVGDTDDTADDNGVPSTLVAFEASVATIASAAVDPTAFGPTAIEPAGPQPAAVELEAITQAPIDASAIRRAVTQPATVTLEAIERDTSMIPSPSPSLRPRSSLLRRPQTIVSRSVAPRPVVPPSAVAETIANNRNEQIGRARTDRPSASRQVTAVAAATTTATATATRGASTTSRVPATISRQDRQALTKANERARAREWRANENKLKSRLSTVTSKYLDYTSSSKYSQHRERCLAQRQSQHQQSSASSRDTTRRQ